jgi:hypothetical protein
MSTALRELIIALPPLLYQGARPRSGRMQMIQIKRLTILPAAVLAAALGGNAAAQTPRSGFEVRPFVGAYFPTGDHRDLLSDAITVGLQGGYAIAQHFSLVATFALTTSSDKRIPLDDDLDLFSYDIGAELTKEFAVGDRGITLAPFVGVGAGGRTYDYRDRESDSETNFAGYGTIGGQLRLGSVSVRLEARDYVSSFKGLTGELRERSTRNDVSVVTALSLSF